MLVRTLFVLLVVGILLGGCGRQTPTAEASRAVKAIALSRSDTVRVDRLLVELRELVEANPEVGGMREHLAGGLQNAIFASGADMARADGFLEELRELATNTPEEGKVRQRLAGGLNNAIAYSGSDFARADRLLDELRELAEAHPEEGKVREMLAMGLRNAINRSGSDFARADGLLGELRGLVERHPDDPAVGGNLIRAYGALLDDATDAGDAGRAAAMAEALVPLREVVLSEASLEGLIREEIAEALGVAVEQGNAEAEGRLRAASEAIFGE